MPTNCLSLFDYFVGLALKGLNLMLFFQTRSFVSGIEVSFPESKLVAQRVGEFVENIVCRRFEPLFYRQPPVGPSPLFIFFLNPPLLEELFRQYRPNEITDKHKNKLMWQRYIFIFRRLKTNVTCFFL